MQDKVFESFAAAVADIPDGASIMLSGFTEPGTPHNLIRALGKSPIGNAFAQHNRPVI
jgi:acyl CoA:acetate/3-ketoacid CoA transferase alpha subunit